MLKKIRTAIGSINWKMPGIAGRLLSLLNPKKWLRGLRPGVGAKLLAAVILTVFVTLGVVTWVVVNAYRDSIIADRMTIIQTTLDNIAEETNRDNLQLGSLVLSMAVSQSNGAFGERLDSLRYTKDLLQRFPSIMGAYIHYEPNADGKDQAYADRVLYTEDGRFIPYWYWQDAVERDVILLSPAEDIEGSASYNATQEKWQQLSGSEAGTEEYLLFSEPYTNPIQWVPMISIAYPITIDKEFKGIVGIDRSLETLHAVLDQVKPYESASLFLLSSSGRFVSVTGEHSWRITPGDKLSDLEDYNNILGNYFTSKTSGIEEKLSPIDEKRQYFAYSPVKTGDWMLVMAVDKEEIVAPINTMVRKIVQISGVAFVLLILITWLASRIIITRPVGRIMNLFGDIGMGNFETRVKVKSRDEIGEMARSLNAMLDNTMALIQTREERDEIQGSIMHLLQEISGLTRGDLTARAEVTEDMTGSIADSFNEMAEQLSQVVREVKKTTDEVGHTSHTISDSTEDLAMTSEKQALQISEVTKSINAMTASIRQVADNAGHSAKVSEQSNLSARKGSEAVLDTNRAMEAIRERVQETARSIKRLGESSQEIGNIVQMINDIADRTSILALNASIQAAMAGEAGRGFAVVAEEVQRLAERSTDSTKQIDTLVKNIQGEINEAGTSMEESIQRVVDGSKLAGEAHGKLQEIEKVSEELSDMIQSISVAAQEQSQKSEEISTTIEAVGEISIETSSASVKTAHSMRQLSDSADRLRDSVKSFKLAEDLTQPEAADNTLENS